MRSVANQNGLIAVPPCTTKKWIWETLGDIGRLALKDDDSESTATLDSDIEITQVKARLMILFAKGDLS